MIPFIWSSRTDKTNLLDRSLESGGAGGTCEVVEMLQIFIQMVVTCVLSRVLKICAFHPMHLNTSMSRCTNLPVKLAPPLLPWSKVNPRPAGWANAQRAATGHSRGGGPPLRVSGKSGRWKERGFWRKQLKCWWHRVLLQRLEKVTTLPPNHLTWAHILYKVLSNTLLRRPTVPRGVLVPHCHKP